MSSNGTKRTPTCQACGVQMRLARTVPKLDGAPALTIYACDSCGETLTQVGVLDEVTVESVLTFVPHSRRIESAE